MISHLNILLEFFKFFHQLLFFHIFVFFAETYFSWFQFLDIDIIMLFEFFNEILVYFDWLGTIETLETFLAIFLLLVILYGKRWGPRSLNLLVYLTRWSLNLLPLSSARGHGCFEHSIWHLSSHIHTSKRTYAVFR